MKMIKKDDVMGLTVMRMGCVEGGVHAGVVKGRPCGGLVGASVGWPEVGSSNGVAATG